MDGGSYRREDPRAYAPRRPSAHSPTGYPPPTLPPIAPAPQHQHPAQLSPRLQPHHQPQHHPSSHHHHHRTSHPPAPAHSHAHSHSHHHPSPHEAQHRSPTLGPAGGGPPASSMPPPTSRPLYANEHHMHSHGAPQNGYTLPPPAAYRAQDGEGPRDSQKVSPYLPAKVGPHPPPFGGHTQSPHHQSGRSPPSHGMATGQGPPPGSQPSPYGASAYPAPSNPNPRTPPRGSSLSLAGSPSLQPLNSSSHAGTPSGGPPPSRSNPMSVSNLLGDDRSTSSGGGSAGGGNGYGRESQQQRDGNTYLPSLHRPPSAGSLAPRRHSEEVNPAATARALSHSPATSRKRRLTDDDMNGYPGPYPPPPVSHHGPPAPPHHQHAHAHHSPFASHSHHSHGPPSSGPPPQSYLPPAPQQHAPPTFPPPPPAQGRSGNSSGRSSADRDNKVPAWVDSRDRDRAPIGVNRSPYMPPPPPPGQAGPTRASPTMNRSPPAGKISPPNAGQPPSKAVGASPNLAPWQQPPPHQHSHGPPHPGSQMPSGQPIYAHGPPPPPPSSSQRPPSHGHGHAPPSAGQNRPDYFVSDPQRNSELPPGGSPPPPVSARASSIGGSHPSFAPHQHGQPLHHPQGALPQQAPSQPPQQSRRHPWDPPRPSPPTHAHQPTGPPPKSGDRQSNKPPTPDRVQSGGQPGRPAPFEPVPYADGTIPQTRAAWKTDEPLRRPPGSTKLSTAPPQAPGSSQVPPHPPAGPPPSVMPMGGWAGGAPPAGMGWETQHPFPHPHQHQHNYSHLHTTHHHVHQPQRPGGSRPPNDRPGPPHGHHPAPPVDASQGGAPVAQPNKRRKYFDRPSGGGSMDGNPAGAEAALARATARNRKPSVSSAQLQSGLPGGPTTAKASPSGLTPPIPPVPKIAVPEVTAQEKLEEASRPPLLQVDNGRVMKALASDPDARAGRKLAGTVRYDPLQPPASLLDGEVLRRNVGADVEVFVDGRWLEGIEWAIGSPGVETGANKWKSTGSSGIIVETPGSGASGRTVKGKAKGDKTTVPDRPSWTFWDLAGIAQRQAWGTDVYTDDSDVLAMCVHSGWLRIKGAETTTWPTTRPPITSRTTSPESGDGGEPETGDTKRVGEEVDMKDAVSDPVSSKTVLPARRRGPRETCTLKVSLKVAPKLVRYQGSLRGGLASRSWGNGHDGVSLIVDRVDVVSQRPPPLGLQDRKLRLRSFVAALRNEKGPPASWGDQATRRRIARRIRKELAASAPSGLPPAREVTLSFF